MSLETKSKKILFCAYLDEIYIRLKQGDHLFISHIVRRRKCETFRNLFVRPSITWLTFIRLICSRWSWSWTCWTIICLLAAVNCDIACRLHRCSS